MSLTSSPYQGADDLKQMLAMLAESIHAAGDCGYLHVGDVPHGIYNSQRRQPDPDPAAYVRLWHDDDAQLIGFAMFHPYRKWFDVQVHAAHRGGKYEAQILAEAEQATLALMRKHNIEAETLSTEGVECDQSRTDLLISRGFTCPKQHSLVITERSLNEPIAEVTLPEGFSIRSAEGVHEAAALGEVHGGAFGKAWTETEYRAVMQSPGYHVENELVVIAPDGRFAAFTINWFDDLNKTALFEPVGTHEDFQRMGLGRSLMTYALQRMKARGIERAYVLHEVDNPASTGLYASMGFKPKYKIFDYVKPLDVHTSTL